MKAIVTNVTMTPQVDEEEEIPQKSYYCHHCDCNHCSHTDIMSRWSRRRARRSCPSSTKWPPVRVYSCFLEPTVELVRSVRLAFLQTQMGRVPISFYSQCHIIVDQAPLFPQEGEEGQQLRRWDLLCRSLR